LQLGEHLHLPLALPHLLQLLGQPPHLCLQEHKYLVKAPKPSTGIATSKKSRNRIIRASWSWGNEIKASPAATATITMKAANNLNIINNLL
jgi:hypothetical protein